MGETRRQQHSCPFGQFDCFVGIIENAFAFLRLNPMILGITVWPDDWLLVGIVADALYADRQP
ncbi:hypothetical protein D3C77_597780 [compost metagenome]